MITHMVGTIERRILVGYRVDPAVAARLLPAPFRPATVQGSAVAGICMIRLGRLRPSGVPAGVGLTTENLAHRFAVEWDDGTGVRRGVYVPRRDTSGRLAALAGGRLFPGSLNHGCFEVSDEGSAIELTYRSDDGEVVVDVRATASTALSERSVFGTTDVASAFYRRDSIGWSPASRGGACEAVELRTLDWNVAPLEVTSIRSSYFDDERRFPAGSIELDSGLLMRSMGADWVALPADAA